MSFDRRLTLVRDGTADVRLEGVVPAGRYQAVTPLRAIVPSAALRKAPVANAEQESQVLMGERFDVLFEDGDFAFGQAPRDGYVGYVARAALGPAGDPATHRVAAIRTYAFERPDIKSAIVGLYGVNNLLTIEAREDRFLKAAGSGWFIAAHLGAIGTAEADYVAVAERFLGAPYQWGGRESLGVDCSGLVQQALAACNRACPRDTDMQRKFFPEVAEQDRRRGDLVFWPGHVAILLDADTILHANAHHMATAVESLAGAIERIEAAGVGKPLGYRRV